MKVPVPIKVYADFENNNQHENNPNTPKNLFKQFPIAVGFYVISPIGNKYNSYFGTDCNKWFVKKMVKLEQEANKYF